jgi:hypothetical protein
MSSLGSSQNIFEATFHLYPPAIPDTAGRRLRVIDAEMIACILRTGLRPHLETLERTLPADPEFTQDRARVTAWCSVLQQGHLAVLAQFTVRQETPHWNLFDRLCDRVVTDPPLEQKGLISRLVHRYHALGAPEATLDDLKEKIESLRQVLDLLLQANEGMRASGLTVASALTIGEA